MVSCQLWWPTLQQNKMAVSFVSENARFKLKHATRIKKWIAKITALEKKELGTIVYTFVNDETLLDMNKHYLNHNTYTDIITFDYTEKKKIAGEIFISTDRVKENAQKFNSSFDNELKRVIIHGILHLCGYKDKTNSDAKAMRLKEERSLKIYSTL
jgi:probable rRNA maturation factor